MTSVSINPKLAASRNRDTKEIEKQKGQGELEVHSSEF